MIQELQPESFGEWDAYIERHPDATCYHLRAWKTVAHSAYRLRSPFLVARDWYAGPIRGVLPLFQINAPLQGQVTNGLFGAYGGILADSPETRLSLVAKARGIFEEQGAANLLFKCLGGDCPEFEGFDCSDNWMIATLPLDPDPDRVWHDLRDKIRNCVRKAQRYQLEARSGRNQLEPFYDVLAENMHSKGAPIYGLGFMRELLMALGDRAEILTLWHGYEVISGAFLIHFNKRTYVPFASSRPRTLHMSPNNLLYWEIIRRSCIRGMETLDFGRSMKNSGPLAFKLGWGAIAEPQPCYIYSASGKPFKPDPQDPRVDWFVRQWKRLPRPVVDRVGPWICKQIAGLA